MFRYILVDCEVIGLNKYSLQTDQADNSGCSRVMVLIQHKCQMAYCPRIGNFYGDNSDLVPFYEDIKLDG